MISNTPVTGSIEAFVQRPDLELTRRQQSYLQARVRLGSGMAATRELYGAEKSDAVIAMLAGQLESNPKIRQAWHVWCGHSPKEAFLEDVAFVIRKSEGVALVRALSLFKSVAFGDTPAPENSALPAAPQHKFSVGDICIQQGQQYRVTSVDAEGQPLTADEVTL